MAFPLRKDVPVEQTWDLTHLFETEAQFEAALANITVSATQFEQRFSNQLTTTNTIVEAIKAYEELRKQMVLVSTYASLHQSVDQKNTENQMRIGAVQTAFAKIAAQTSFLQSDLLQLDAHVLEEASSIAPQYAHFIAAILREKPHTLHPEVEKALAAFSGTFSAPYSLYNTTKLVDMKFPNFDVNGESLPMSYNLFEGDWELETDTEKRHAAFHAFYSKLADYQHTTAKTYEMAVKQEKTEADLRGHDSVLDFLLFPQEVDRTLYNRQIDIIMNELAPHMRKYAKLVQRVHNLERMTFADLKISLDPGYEPTITVEQSRQYMKDGLAVMGYDYMHMLDRAFDERWIDFANNEGKSTGAFCSSPYGAHPYVLISWTSRMNEVFVLAHELGHAGHFYNSQQHQNIFDARPSLYFIEAPSTMNEMLMANYLLQNSNDARFKRWVISSVVARTYYHNFVTHLLEAAYQRDVYEAIDAGKSLNAPFLNQLKRNVLETFWGDAVDINAGAELTWMRQPHYYMGLYPYTYSAGLTISTQVSQRILREGQVAVDEWLAVLQAGGTKSPVELAKMARVDLTTEQPLRDTIAYIGSLIDELETLTNEL